MIDKIQLIIMLGFSWTLAAQTSAIDYIQQYSDIAIEEMERTGIPASIKLAQGLLESSAGTSPLCIEANNHFGIKCGNQWTGKEMYREDDDYGVNNVLTKSCFRVFDSGRESYRAHSEFIMNPLKAYRYGFLFSIPFDDHQSWARGLQSAGYATDPAYADKLIELINRYHLQQYDYAHLFNELVDTELSSQATEYTKPSVEKVQQEANGQLGRLVHYSHQTLAGETIQSIAQQYDIEPRQFDQANQWSHLNPLPIGTELTWNTYLP